VGLLGPAQDNNPSNGTSRWVRTVVLALVFFLALTVVAHATTWVFWVGAPNANNPSNGTSTTWGYWGGTTFFTVHKMLTGKFIAV